MSRVNVDIQPEVLKWALEHTEGAQLDETMKKNIKLWLDGTKKPTFSQIESLSKKINIPLGYFFLQTPPEEKIELLEYRTIDSIDLHNPSRNLIDTIYEMQSVQDWMKDYRMESGFGILPFVSSLKGYNNINDIVRIIRDDIDLDISWYTSCKNSKDAFKYIRSLLEHCGIIVMLNGIVGKNTHRSLNIEEFRAFAMVDEWAPLIFINNSDSHGAKLFSLFHEAAHIWLGEDDLFNDRRDNNSVKPLETLCNAVASELIVPFEAFIQEWNNSSVNDVRLKICNLSKLFNCGESVIARKALDASIIKSDIYREVVNDAIKAYKEQREHKTDGGDYYNNLTSRLDGCFVRALCESLSDGKTTLTEACRLTNTNRKTFFEVASRFGGNI